MVIVLFYANPSPSPPCDTAVSGRIKLFGYEKETSMTVSLSKRLRDEIYSASCRSRVEKLGLPSTSMWRAMERNTESL